MAQQRTPFTVMPLGDVVRNEGLAVRKDTLLSAQEQSRADALLGLVQGQPLGRLYFVPGGKGWGNSGRNSLKTVRRLEGYLAKQLPGQNAFAPMDSCPGPEVVAWPRWCAWWP